MRFIFVLSILPLFFAPTCAVAKCVYDTFVVSGRITSTHGAPVAGARISVSWRDWGEESKDAVSDSDGHYSVTISFSLYSGVGVFGADRCDAKLRTVLLALTKTGLVPLQREIAITGHSTVANEILSFDQASEPTANYRLERP